MSAHNIKKFWHLPAREVAPMLLGYNLCVTAMDA